MVLFLVSLIEAAALEVRKLQPGFTLSLTGEEVETQDRK